MLESATGATFAVQKQESPDAKVLCPSGCWRIILSYRYNGRKYDLAKPSILIDKALPVFRDTACGYNDFCSVG